MNLEKKSKPMHSMEYDALLKIVLHAMTCSPQRGPQSIYDSFYEIEKFFGECGKIAMLIHIGSDLGDLNITRPACDEVVSVDNMAQLVKLLKRHGIDIRNVP